jgi:hypothetical protein
MGSLNHLIHDPVQNFVEVQGGVEGLGKVIKKRQAITGALDGF